VRGSDPPQLKRVQSGDRTLASPTALRARTGVNASTRAARVFLWALRSHVRPTYKPSQRGRSPPALICSPSSAAESLKHSTLCFFATVEGVSVKTTAATFVGGGKLAAKLYTERDPGRWSAVLPAGLASPAQIRDGHRPWSFGPGTKGFRLVVYPLFTLG